MKELRPGNSPSVGSAELRCLWAGFCRLKSQLVPWSLNFSCKCSDPWRTLCHYMKLFSVPIAAVNTRSLCSFDIKEFSHLLGVPKCFQLILESPRQSWVDAQGSCVNQPEALGPLRALFTAGFNSKWAAVVQWMEQLDLGTQITRICFQSAAPGIAAAQTSLGCCRLTGNKSELLILVAAGTIYLLILLNYEKLGQS